MRATLILLSLLAALPAAAQPRSFRDCADCPQMVAIPPGAFLMGVTAEEEVREGLPGRISGWSSPPMRVELRGFAMGRSHVTRGEFAAFVAATGHATGPCGEAGLDWRNPGFAQTDAHPLVCVQWSDAVAYAAWLSARTGRAYGLPSEAQFEYASRAGTTTARFWGDGRAEACAHANVADRAHLATLPPDTDPARNFTCDDGFARTAPVASFPPNAFGLHDMLGNAWQWMADCWTTSLADLPRDGSARDAPGCTERTVRGGGWNYSPRYLRAGFRYGEPAGDIVAANGFRVVRRD
jgi:formylglycine-generating enzyme required for sulfatase activity